MKMTLEKQTPKKSPKLKKELESDLEEQVEKNMGEKLKKIKEFENKFKKRWEFEGDYNYYFSIAFRNQDERDAFLKKQGIKLRDGAFVFYDDLPENIK